MVAVNPLVRAVITVTAFWWLILVGVAFVVAPKMFTTHDGLAFIADFVRRGALYWVAGFVLTVLAVIVAAITNRVIRTRSLKAGRLRGVFCTLGPVPIARSGLPMADLPDLTNAERYEYGPDILAWLQSNREKHPKHVAALEAVIRVLASREWLPASHIPGGHGNRSLIDHSLRVGGIALKFAPTFEYAGLVSRYNTVPMRDPGYRFDATDPLIPIVAVAHDIGKIATFLVEKGKVVGAQSNHDLAGARMLALLDEVGDLPPDDRNALMRAVAHYHHESAYPVAPDGRVERDRDVALMMLLIKSDNAAGKHEGKHFMTANAYAQWLRAREESGDALDADEKRILQTYAAKASASAPGHAAAGQQGAAQAISDEAVYSALQRILLAPKAVSRDTRTRGDVVGQLNLCRPPQWAEDIMRDGGQFDAEQAEMLRESMVRRIVIREDLLRKALSASLGISPKKRGDGRYDLSIRALEVLYAKGVLDNECSDGFVTPHSALFHLNWINRKTFQDIAMWRNAILLKPEGFLESFATGDVHDSYYQIVRPVWKDRLVRPGGDISEVADEASGVPVNLDDAEEILERSAVLDEATNSASETEAHGTEAAGSVSPVEQEAAAPRDEPARDLQPDESCNDRGDEERPVRDGGEISTQDAIQALMRGNLSALRAVPARSTTQVDRAERHGTDDAPSRSEVPKLTETSPPSVPALRLGGAGPKLRPGAKKVVEPASDGARSGVQSARRERDEQSHAKLEVPNPNATLSVGQPASDQSPPADDTQALNLTHVKPLPFAERFAKIKIDRG